MWIFVEEDMTEIDIFSLHISLCYSVDATGSYNMDRKLVHIKYSPCQK